MAAAELPRPGVDVIQEFQSAAPTIIRPTLVPFVAGAAKEIVEVTTADGLLNAAAKQGSYEQLPRVISQTSFPSPRNNIAEVNVEESTIRAFFQFGGALRELERDPGEAFLVAQNLATRPSVRAGLFTTSSGLNLDGLILILAFDVTARLNTTKDVIVTFSGNSLTPAQIIAQINAAVGETVASYITVDTKTRIVLTSTEYGAAASVTVRAGGSANSLFGWPSANEVRVEGSGFRAQDLNNNTTLSPWIEWSKGAYLIDGVAQSSLPSYSDSSGSPTNGDGFGFTDSDGVFSASFIADTTLFTGNNSLDLKVGDQFVADGIAPNNALIMRVETARFKLGTLNTKLSVFGDNGKVTSAVYDQSSVNTLLSSVPFAPRYAWFQARGLSVSTSNQAAVLTGSAVGTSATTATVTAPSAPAGSAPFALAGLTLDVDVTIDGVLQDTYTFTFTGGPFADLAAIIAAIGTNIPGAFAHLSTDNTKLALSTVKTGAQQVIDVKSSSTGLVALGFVAATDYSATGTDVDFEATPAVLLGGTQSFNFAGTDGETFVVKTSTDGGSTWSTTKTYTFATGHLTFTDIDGLITELTTATRWNGGTLPTTFTISNDGNKIKLTTTGGGPLTAIKVDASSTAIGTGATTELLFTGDVPDIGESALLGQRLKFKLNNRSYVYDVTFVSASLIDAVTSINELVGWPVASVGGDDENQLVLTSTLKGYASKIEVISDSDTTLSSTLLGFGSGNRIATGSGRPNPDFYLDISGNVNLGGEVLRSQITGDPFSPGTSDVYIQYRGLRKDVSAIASSPALLRISNVADLQTVLSPIRADNPLALGFFFMMINAPNIECTGLGIDEISGEEPYGTPEAYARVTDFLESEEVYAIAPLTHNETVAQIFKAHIESMSAPDQKGERILFINPEIPTRRVNDVIVSSTGGETTATSNQFVLDVNPIAGLAQRSLDPSSLSVDDDVVLEISVEGVVRRYSVASINSTLCVLRTTFGTTENKDAFFTTTTLSETLINESWELYVRGTPLVIPGSSLPDKQAIAETIQAKAQAYQQRRLYYVFPDKVEATVAGSDQVIEGFYAAAAAVGMVARFPPQQPFTNLPITGFTGVVGATDYFSNKQLNIIAAGSYILMQEVQGAPLICRMQCSTNISTIETRELSITKIVDFCAKFLRTGLRTFIGTFNITQPFLDTLSTVIQGMLQFLVENGIILGGDLNNLIQSKDSPDTVLVDVTLDVPFPCNYIRLTIVI